MSLVAFLFFVALFRLRISLDEQLVADSLSSPYPIQLQTNTKQKLSDLSCSSWWKLSSHSLINQSIRHGRGGGEGIIASSSKIEEVMILRSHLRSCSNNNHSRRRMGRNVALSDNGSGGSADMMNVDDTPPSVPSVSLVVSAAAARGNEQQPVDDPEAVKVVDTLDNVLGCLNRNIHTNIIYFPRAPTQLDESDADRLVEALRTNTSLTNITIEESRMSNLHAVKKLTSALLEHSNLQRLTFYDNRLGDEGAATIVNVLHQYSTSRIPMQLQQQRPNPTSLHALCLCGNQIGDRGAYWIAQGLEFYKSIHELDLSSNEISEHGATYLAAMLSQSQLTAFILNGNQASHVGAKAIAEAVHKNQRLDVLGLCGNDIGDDGAICVANVAKTHPRLKAILLEDNFLGERGIMAVADAHRLNPRLGMMEVSWNFVSPTAMQVVSNSMSEVIYLYLDHCEIGDTHMQILGTGLANNRSIKDLFLEGNHISLGGVQALARALSKNTFLGGVFLDGNPITRQGAYVLRDVLQHTNKTLKRVQIHDDYHDIQREIDVYLDMNGAGRKRVLQRDFPIALWSDFLSHKNVSKDSDLVYLFLKERPDLFQRYAAACPKKKGVKRKIVR